MPDDTMAVYLNDHLGLIAGEMERINRVASENEGTSLAAFLSTYAHQVQQQRDALESLLTSAGSAPSALKQAVGWLAEKVGRLRPNDALTGYTDLARVIEMETLISAAQSRGLM